MENKKFDLKSTFDGAKKNAAKFMEKTKDTVINGVDQNDDGKFDKDDISAIADSIESKLKNTAQIIKENAEERSRQAELKRLQPIFNENINNPNFIMPKFIRITERDKKYIESEVCNGAIGYLSDQKGLHIVNIFRDSVAFFNLSLYPDQCNEFYCIDPSEEKKYIALNEYFNYLKVERINEIQMIAKDLGAKHFKVTYKEEKSVSATRSAKAKARVTDICNAEAAHTFTENECSVVEIAAELDCEGHKPIMPQLKYMEKDPSIKTLVAMRMDNNSPLSHQKFTLKLSNTSGIKESDAVKIDAVLESMKIAGNTSVLNEVENEARRYLEYEIDF